jgi:hypothetical protein
MAQGHTRSLLYFYRFCEVCTLINVLVFSATARPWGFFYWAGVRSFGTAASWLIALREGGLSRGAPRPGVLIYNALAFDDRDHMTDMAFARWLHCSRFLEIPLVWIALWLLWQRPFQSPFIGMSEGPCWAAEFDLRRVPSDCKNIYDKAEIDVPFGQKAIDLDANNFGHSGPYLRLAKFVIVSVGILGSGMFMLLEIMLWHSKVYRGANNFCTRCCIEDSSIEQPDDSSDSEAE